MTDYLYLLKEEAAFAGGTFDGTVWRDGGLALAAPGQAAQGRFISPEIKAPAFSALLGSWNAGVPAGCTVELSARVQAQGVWSGWLRWGEWSAFAQRASAPGQGDGTARLEGDMLCVEGGSAFQLCVVLRGDGSTGPVVYRLAAALKTLRWQPERGEALHHRAVPVPAYSLLIRDPRIGADAAVPAACMMLMNRWGEDLLPEEAAYACYDYGARTYRNRSFAIALAGAYGFESYAVFTDAAGLKREVKNGCGCGVCLHGAQGGPGRVLVVRGFETTEDGVEYVLVNDPLAPTDAEAQSRLALDEFLAAWDGRACLVHRREDGRHPCGPLRVAGELRRTELPGEYALYIKGERTSLPTDLCRRDGRCTGTVCYTVRDGHAYATAAHKRFYYTDVSASGNLLLDTASMPAGTQLTVYVITELGKMATAGLTV